MASTQLSPAAHQRLAEELEHRSGPLRREISERIERARELGDLKENADYDAAKNEQGLNEARVRQIEAMLRDVEIVESSVGDAVEAGIVVEIRMAGDEDTERYLIGSIEEQHPDMDVISPTSPLGSVLLGRQVGDTVNFAAPGGELSVTIVEIDV